MKATRRHELKESDLAHSLETARSYLVEHGGRVGLVVILVIAIAAVVGITVRTRADNIERAWAMKSKLLYDNPEDGKESIEKLRKLAGEADDESFVFTSLIEQGSHALRLAQQVESPPDPDLNNRARDAFEQMMARFSDNPLALGVAHSGLATVAENDFALDADLGHREQAQKHLQAILDNADLNSLPFHRVASDRMAKLDSVFTVVRFVTAPEPEEPPVLRQPVEAITITPTPISIDEVPPNLRLLSGEVGEVPPAASGEDESVEGEGVDAGAPSDAVEVPEDAP